MRTILLTYEFGAGLGHLNRLIAVAKRLAGHRLIFALPDRALGEPVIRRTFGEAADVRSGVIWPAPVDPGVRQVPTHTFADVISLFGFGDPKRLREAAERGRKLLDETAPDLIVADFAPTLRLASEKRVPTIVVGNGYTVPPAGCLLPPMRSWETEVNPVSRAAEARLLAAVNDYRAASGGASIDHFADLLSGDRSFACTVAEFDPYRSVRTAATVWPFNVPDVRPGPVVPERQGSPVFCYFQRDHPALHAVIGGISRVKARCEVYVQGADPQVVAARCGRNVAIHRNPVDFSTVLPRTRVLVHHAGLGTAYAGLLAGTPQLLLPLNLEHAITARGVDLFGTSLRLGVNPPPAPEVIARQIEGMLGDAALHARAARAADDLAQRRVADPVAPIAQACLDFL